MVYDFDALRTYVEDTLKRDVLEPRPEPDALYAPFRYALDSGGKRLRPVLLLMAYNLFRDDVENAFRPAIAVEVFHNFTLLHDDIMDDSPMRRNKPTVHKKWNANTAILSGDAMMIKAYQFITEHVNTNLPEVLRVFNHMALKVCEGQQYDMNYEARQHVSEQDYLRMIGLKTSALLAGSMKIGSLLAGKRTNEANALYAIGMNLGLAFQLQDDLLDSFGDTQQFGKRIGGDIVANKKTYLLIKAFELAGKKQYAELEHWIFGDEASGQQEKINAVLAIYKDLGIEELTQNKIEAYYNDAWQRLRDIDVPQERKNALEEVAHMLERRVY